MNAVEIEAAVSQLAAQRFVPEDFPYVFLEAFGNKATTIKRLRGGSTNASDLPNGVLQRNNIHIAACESGTVTQTLAALKASSATTKAKAKFVLATDGETLEAEELTGGVPLVCNYVDLADHFGFFLPLAGITTVRQIHNNPVDIQATGRLNQLYIELLKTNEDWAGEARRHDMNHFMARLIFCFFAEDTDIFNGDGLFTATVEQMSDARADNADYVIGELFRAMDTPTEARAAANLRPWADQFPYVNGGLFSGNKDAPRFSRIARSYLLHAGNLDWKRINPDIFGSMIQAVADEEERGQLGMHYTSVPNILKVLNPLFLDDLRRQLDRAGGNPRKLLNLRKRLARIRVFDPACGSGNFLVIAYKQMREIENQINERRGEPKCKSEIPLTNFRGIEIRDFAAEIARLALIIAEYQCDVLYRGQQEALAEFLPLDKNNWITCGNALRLDWLSICPPTGKGVQWRAEDLFEQPSEQGDVDFGNEGGETFICGNPPYKGSQTQTKEQKVDLEMIFSKRTKNWKSLDYVAGWFIKAADFGVNTNTISAFVATNSICQGRQVSTLWPLIFDARQKIAFAYNSFKWSNLAKNNAGVTVVIIGIADHTPVPKRIFIRADETDVTMKTAENISAYLVSGPNVWIKPSPRPISELPEMSFGNMPNDGGHLLLTPSEANDGIHVHGVDPKYIRHLIGSQELIRGIEKRCIWVEEEQYESAQKNMWLKTRFNAVYAQRIKSNRKTTHELAFEPYRFGEIRQSGKEKVIVVPRVSSENRDFLPTGLLARGSIVLDSAFALYDAPLWNLALIASRLHLVWIATVCGKLKTDFRYSNTLGWNTFPVPTLTAQDKTDLTRRAEDILLVREAHFPATIAELYAPEKMPADLCMAHERNDETLERIYIGRRFKNDTERLETLFDLYAEMTAAEAKSG